MPRWLGSLDIKVFQQDLLMLLAILYARRILQPGNIDIDGALLAILLLILIVHPCHEALNLHIEGCF